MVVVDVTIKEGSDGKKFVFWFLYRANGIRVDTSRSQDKYLTLYKYKYTNTEKN